MTTRDLAWRGAGLVLFAIGCASAVLDRLGGGALNGLLSFALALAGVVLMLQGKRVPAAWRVERSRHRELPGAIRVRRHRRLSAKRNRD